MKWLLFLSLFLMSCIDQPITRLFSTSEDEGARNQLRERVRSRSLRDSSARCSESERCKETCEDMYLKATDLDRCYNAKESRVKAISDVFDILINPDRLSDLNDIDPTDFSHFLNIGWRGFLDLIDPVHRDEDGDRRNTYWEDIYAYDADTALLVLEWIANEEQIARSVSSKDEDLDITRHLFCIAGRSISPEEQKQYVCDLWGIDNCNNLILSNGIWTPPNPPNSYDWSIVVQDMDDPPPSGICHDHPASLYVGLTQGEYDDVGFSTYAEAQDNDQAQEIVEDIIDDICGTLDVNNLCVQFYICPVRVKYEGYDLDEDPYCNLYKEAVDGL